MGIIYPFTAIHMGGQSYIDTRQYGLVSYKGVLYEGLFQTFREPQPSLQGEGSPLEPQPSLQGEGSPLDYRFGGGNRILNGWLQRRQ